MPRVYNKRLGDVPPGAIYVGRGSKFGNPFTHHPRGTAAAFRVPTREEAVDAYRWWITSGGGRYLLPSLVEIQGKDLVCWCTPLPCHADVLLDLAKPMKGWKERGDEDPPPYVAEAIRQSRMRLGARRSYRQLSSLSAWLLLGEDERIVASVRAKDGELAREIFRRAAEDHPRRFSGGKWIRRSPEN